MHRRIAKLQVLLLCKPTLDFLVAAEPLRLGEALLEALHHLRWDRLLTGLWSRILDLLDLLDPAFFVELNPIGDRVATGAQLASRPASAFGLSSLSAEEASGNGAGSGRQSSLRTSSSSCSTGSVISGRLYIAGGILQAV